MLVSLSIRNIALMDEMQVEFSKGLHVLTGETGAGKSIIVDAISLLLGGRAQKELIRNGCDKARVEGVFDLSDCPGIHALLQQQELDENGEELILSRDITLQGRSSCRVNGALMPLAQYQLFTALLMDIHGQHEHQSLMDEKRHLGYLDASGDENHQALLKTIHAHSAAWKESKSALEKLKKQSAQAAERTELLRLRQKELKNAKLVPGEEEDLSRERDRYRNVEKIESGLRAAFDAVYDGMNPAAEALREAVNALSPIENLDDEYAALRARLDGLYYEAEDIGLTLRDLLRNLDSDPDRLEFIQARLDLIRRLSRKYGGADTKEMVKKLTEIEEELSAMENIDDLLDEAVKKEKAAAQQYQKTAQQLTLARRALAHKFEKEMEIQLRDLNMAGTKFQVSLPLCPPGPLGNETAAFQIAPNRGEEMQPLSKIASGGELSRLMLAIKSVAAKRDGVPSMIFDEIDTGISGRAAQVVGEKMAAIGRERQVLCVTHLQQIAALADHHFLVEKSFDGERTRTRLTPLTGESRVAEIARMLGGEDESAKAHAREMLKIK
ncbi:MAG: DNA repair protein RecN [Clostridiales bacterium]|nr:DNA repair protein RecN [Clostridiales bacterium]